MAVWMKLKDKTFGKVSANIFSNDLKLLVLTPRRYEFSKYWNTKAFMIDNSLFFYFSLRLTKVTQYEEVTITLKQVGNWERHFSMAHVFIRWRVVILIFLHFTAISTFPITTEGNKCVP